MSLSARIVLRPSRRLAVCESLVAGGGIAVAAAALVVRWPTGVWAILLVAAGCGLALALPTTRRSAAVVVVSDRPEVGLMTMDAAAHADAGSWRLAEGTMVWPGISIVALTSDTGVRRTMVVPDRDLVESDRRALHRFLLWTLRGGAGRRAAEA